MSVLKTNLPATESATGAASTTWSAAQATELYQVEHWGAGYFKVSEAGDVMVRPDPARDQEINLREVVDGLQERGLSAPVLIRFSDILAHRLRHLHQAFASAIAENEYRGEYAAVYPVKVNQQRPVVEEVYRFGEGYAFGLEVGSKPELLAVMATTGRAGRRLIICNGFKDDDYIEAVVLATKLGRMIVPVVEGMEELHLIIKHAERYGVRPRIGVRVKLASEGAGRWQASVGEKSKFGLFVSEVLELLDVLKQHDMADCLQLLHCHPGSQIQDIRCVKDAINELSHVYAELVRLGAGLRFLDVGGGLGVDYDGSQSNSSSSINYTLEEYASDVIYRIASVCNERRIPHPMIISESGRAIVAYHSVLVFNVLGRSGFGRAALPSAPALAAMVPDDAPPPIRDLLDAFTSVRGDRLVECFHDAQQAHRDAINLFNVGYLPLELRGLAEQLYHATCVEVREQCRTLEDVPEELEDLRMILRDTYFCNFSVFQSLPDSWAIDQLFPIMPIHRLSERPTRQAVLADITCDSDGKVDRFVDHQRRVRETLDVHELEADRPYYLAAFLVGAYQETLGDLHNLFGDTHVVHLRLHEGGGWWIEEVVKGDTAREVLSYVQYDADRLVPELRRDCEQAVRDGKMTVAESRALLGFYESELAGYTYLDPVR